MRRPRHRWVRACAQQDSDLPRGGTADVTGDYRHCTKPRSATVSAASSERRSGDTPPPSRLGSGCSKGRSDWARLRQTEVHLPTSA